MSSIIILAFSVAFLIVCVSVFKINAIPVLLIAGLFVGIASGGQLDEVTESLLNGFGNTLKWIGLVILFGSLLGEILAKTGGADHIANGIIKVFGIKRLPLGISIVGFLVGIPVFMDVAYLTLLPTINSISKKSGHSLLVLGLCLAMSLTISHALIPPTPGPLAVASLLEIEIGSIIPTNVLIGFGAMLIGLLWITYKSKTFSTFVSQNSEIEEPSKSQLNGLRAYLPYFALLLPLVFLTIGAFISSDYAIGGYLRSPIWTLMTGVVIASFLFKREDFTNQLNNCFNDAASKSAMVILITGAGGAFGQVIKDTQIVNSIFTNISSSSSLVIIMPFLLSFVFTTLTGSITVSLLTSTAIMAPIIIGGSLSPQLAAAAIGAGSLGIIHVNSSFFWLFKEVHGFSLPQVLKSFSLLSVVTSLGAGFLVVLLWFLGVF